MSPRVPWGKFWPSPGVLAVLGSYDELAHSGVGVGSRLPERNPGVCLPSPPMDAALCSVPPPLTTSLLGPGSIAPSQSESSFHESARLCASVLGSFFVLNGMRMVGNCVWEGVYGVLGRTYFDACLKKMSMRVCNMDAVFVGGCGGKEGKRSNTWFEFVRVDDFGSPSWSRLCFVQVDTMLFFLPTVPLPPGTKCAYFRDTEAAGGQLTIVISKWDEVIECFFHLRSWRTELIEGTSKDLQLKLRAGMRAGMETGHSRHGFMEFVHSAFTGGDLVALPALN